MDKSPHGALYVDVLTKADDSFRHNPSPLFPGIPFLYMLYKTAKTHPGAVCLFSFAT